MKTTMFYLWGSISFLAILLLTSCRHYGSSGNDMYFDPVTEITSQNQFNLNVADEPIYYTIDISTDAGAAKLKGLSLAQAQKLALTEAIMVNGCATLINPRYTQLVKGKNVLRVTVMGFPAKYKNRPEPTYDKRERYEIEVK